MKKCIDIISFSPIKYIKFFTKRPFTNYPKDNDNECRDEPSKKVIIINQIINNNNNDKKTDANYLHT